MLAAQFARVHAAFTEKVAAMEGRTVLQLPLDQAAAADSSGSPQVICILSLQCLGMTSAGQHAHLNQLYMGLPARTDLGSVAVALREAAQS